jgi:hypothetical protein
MSGTTTILRLGDRCATPDDLRRLARKGSIAVEDSSGARVGRFTDLRVRRHEVIGDFQADAHFAEDEIDGCEVDLIASFNRAEDGRFSPGPVKMRRANAGNCVVSPVRSATPFNERPEWPTMEAIRSTPEPKRPPTFAARVEAIRAELISQGLGREAAHDGANRRAAMAIGRGEPVADEPRRPMTAPKATGRIPEAFAASVAKRKAEMVANGRDPILANNESARLAAFAQAKDAGAAEVRFAEIERAESADLQERMAKRLPEIMAAIAKESGRAPEHCTREAYKRLMKELG